MNSHFKLKPAVIAKLMTAFLTLFGPVTVDAQLKLPNYFSDQMVLQRGEPVKVWGWGKPGAEVTVRLATITKASSVNSDSTWTVTLPSFDAGGPQRLSVSSANEKLSYDEIYFGDVWFCSGQSNMSFQVKQAKDYEMEVNDADYPMVRELSLALESSVYPKNDIKKAVWKKASAKTIGNFSAVAWFFAKALYQKNKVPIGIIHSSWGGTPIEAFMAAKDLQGFPVAKKKIDALTPEFIRNTEENNERLVKASGVANPSGFVNVRNGYPTLVYNAMVAPFFGFPIKGVLWYQGEANSHLPVCYDYERLLTGMIGAWRSSWNRPDLPFIIVQLANYTQKVTSVSPVSGWAILQEAQYRVSQSVNNVGIVITNDIGNANDPHPTNKQEVGKRAAAVALNEVYGLRKLYAHGPSMKSVRISGNQLKIVFDGLGGGLIAKGGGNLLNGFLLAADDQKFFPATAEISGDNVLVYSNDVPQPKYVRYAFVDHLESVNFYNKAGFPAVPFRTDPSNVAPKR